MYLVLDVAINHLSLINPPRLIWKRKYHFWENFFHFQIRKLLEIYKQILVSPNTNVSWKLSLNSKLITKFLLIFHQFIEQVRRMQLRCRYGRLVWHAFIAHKILLPGCEGPELCGPKNVRLYATRTWSYLKHVRDSSKLITLEWLQKFFLNESPDIMYDN